MTCPPDLVRFAEDRLLRRLLEGLPEDVATELREVEHALAEAFELLHSLGEVYHYTRDETVLSRFHSLKSRCWACYTNGFVLAVWVCSRAADPGAVGLKLCKETVRRARDCVARVLHELRETLAYYTLARY